MLHWWFWHKLTLCDLYSHHGYGQPMGPPQPIKVSRNSVVMLVIVIFTCIFSWIYNKYDTKKAQWYDEYKANLQENNRWLLYTDINSHKVIISTSDLSLTLAFIGNWVFSSFITSPPQPQEASGSKASQIMLIIMGVTFVFSWMYQKYCMRKREVYFEYMANLQDKEKQVANLSLIKVIKQ